MDFRLVILIPLIAAGAGLAKNHFSAPQSKTAAVASPPSSTKASTALSPLSLTEIKVTDKDGSYAYQLDTKRTTLRVTETSFLSNTRKTQGGLTAQLAYFDDKSTQLFEKTFKNTRQCPARFFNRHSKHKSLITTSPLVKAELKRWENLTWKNTDGWNHTQLQGRCITGANSYMVKGQELASRLPKSVLSKCSYFYVEKVISRKPYLETQKTL